MMITSQELRVMLRGIVERNPFISIWQKTQGGHVVRFFNWKNAARRYN